MKTQASTLVKAYIEEINIQIEKNRTEREGLAVAFNCLCNERDKLLTLQNVIEDQESECEITDEESDSMLRRDL